MDHSIIEKHNIPFLYLQGKLAPEEQERFEMHFTACPECLDLLETTERFVNGLKNMTTEEILRPHGYVQVGVLAWLVRLSSKRRAILLSMILLLVALPGALFVAEIRRGRGELDRAKLALEDSRRQLKEKQQAAQKLEAELQETRQKSAEQRRQLEIELERERQESARLTHRVNSSRPIRSIATVFSLVSTRSADPTEPFPKNEIVISRSAQLIRLSPEFNPDPEIRIYRGAITTEANRSIWRGDKLQLNVKGTIEIGFSARLFKPGDYLFTLEGLTTQGNYIHISKYPFTVTIR